MGLIKSIIVCAGAATCGLMASDGAEAFAGEISVVSSLDGHPTNIKSLQFVDDDRRILSTDRALGIGLWELKSKQLSFARTGTSVFDDYASVVWAPTGGFIFSASGRGVVSAFDANGVEIYAHRFPVTPLVNRIVSVALTSDERFVAFKDNVSERLVLMSTESWHIVWQSETKANAPGRALTFDDSNSFILSANDYDIDVYSAESGRLVKTIKVSDQSWHKRPSQLIFGIERTWFARNARFAIVNVVIGPNTEPAPGRVVSSNDSGIAVVNLKTAKIVYLASGMGKILAAQMSRDQSQILILHSAKNGVIEKHDLIEGRLVGRKSFAKFFSMTGGYSFERDFSPAFAISEDLSMMAVPAPNDRKINLLKIPEEFEIH